MSEIQHIAITGGIGSGKSYVCRMLSEAYGINVYDCDAAAKRLMRTSEELRRKLTNLIGPDAYVTASDCASVQSANTGLSAGSSPAYMLNKAAIARFLLLSEANAKAIDNIVHPAVAADFLASGMTWLESAILFQSGFNTRVHFDTVVLVSAPEDVRVERIMKRDNLSREKAQQWIDRQWTQDELRKRADYEIINDGHTPLLPQIEKIILNLNH